MAAEEVLNLFESLWFGNETSTKTSPPSSPQPQEQNPFPEAQEHVLEVNEPDLNSHLQTLHGRSMSDQSLWSKTSSVQFSFSPNSVLSTDTKLQPILSGKVMKDQDHDGLKIHIPKNIVDPTRASRRSTRRKKQMSKSLSELEFDEVKGFMDLGFMFSEEDKDSSLASIIPGLHRFGSREYNKIVEENHVAVSRPYLSESWDALDQTRKEKASMVNWRVPSLGNEIAMKDHLKVWAHSVASAVR